MTTDEEIHKLLTENELDSLSNVVYSIDDMMTPYSSKNALYAELIIRYLLEQSYTTRKKVIDLFNRQKP